MNKIEELSPFEFPSYWECPNCHNEMMADEVDPSEYLSPQICNRCDGGIIMEAIYENYDD